MGSREEIVKEAGKERRIYLRKRKRKGRRGRGRKGTRRPKVREDGKSRRREKGRLESEGE